MPIPLGLIFEKIFKPPPDGIRQVVAISRANVERLSAVESAAVISITSPGKAIAELASFEHILRLSFADVDFLSINLSPKAKSKLSERFTKEHARELLTFVETLPDAITTVIVHCEGGFSRSCAVAQALHELYEYRVDHGQLRAANPSVLATIQGVAEAQRKSRKKF